MIFCTNCGKQLEDGSLFCDNCGTKLEVQPEQPVQQAQPQFEQPIQQAQPQFEQPVQQAQPQFDQPVQQAQPQFEQPVQQAQPQFEQPQFTQQAQPMPQPVPQPAFAGASAPAAKKPLNKNLIIIGAAAAAAVVLIIVLLFIFLGGKGGQNYLYIKDGEINISNNGAKAWELTDSLLYDNTIGLVKISDDGNRIFYPDRNALYYKNPNDQKAEGVKVASGIECYDIDAGGNNVLYKTNGGDLYKYSVSADDKSKVGSNVSYYYCSKDLSKIAFLTTDNVLYVKYGEDDKVKVDSDVTGWYVSEDYNTFIYIKENSLYKKTVSTDEKEKIATDVNSIENVYFDGGVKLYYTKKVENTINYWDVVTDDLADSDAKMTEPVSPEYPEYPTRGAYPDYPYSFDYDNEEDYKKAKEEYEKKKKEVDEAYDKAREEYDKAVDEYEKAREKYWDDYSAYNEKLNRDELREKLKTQTTTTTTYSLYFYNGTEETKLCDNVSDDYRTGYCDTASEAPVIVYNQLPDSAVSVKVKMSEISSVYDIEYAITNSMDSADVETKLFIASEATANEVTISDISSYRLSNDGSTIYYTIADSDSSEYSDLYKATVSGGAISGETEIDKDIANNNFFVFEDKVMYAKEYDSENSTASMYVDGTLIDDEIYYYSGVNVQNDTYYYFTDYNETSGKATLMCKKSGGEAVKIKDDVSEFLLCADGSVLYMYDYSNTSNRGELYLYRNGNSEKLDDDVSQIVAIYNKNALLGYYNKLS